MDRTNLFLCSSFSEVTDKFQQFLTKFPLEKTVTFIPTASLVEEVDFYVDEARKAFQQMGFTVSDLEISKTSKEVIEQTLRHTNFIYLAGGNTFYLLEQLKLSGADKLIIDQVEAGKIYIGESAGAVVASPNIGYAAKMVDRTVAKHLSSDEGLYLTVCFPLPHYKEEPFHQLTVEILNEFNYTLEIVPLKNNEVLIVEGKAFSVR